MAGLAGGLLLGTAVAPALTAIAFGTLIGAAGGSIRAPKAATFPAYFGTAHLGTIRGLVTARSVSSTAIGPLLFAAAHDVTGSYSTPVFVEIEPLGSL